MLAIKINSVRDGMYWYRGYEGKLVPYHRTAKECYLSREPAGYVNIVEFEDGEIIEVPDDTQFY
jgi:hypothetical protein